MAIHFQLFVGFWLVREGKGMNEDSPSVTIRTQIDLIVLPNYEIGGWIGDFSGFLE